MCGIVCSWGDKCVNVVINGLQQLSSRGKDGCGVVTSTQSIYKNSPFELVSKDFSTQFAIGHLLHAMNGFVVQPLSGKGIFVFNGEIYNWRELCRSYEIDAHNDTQTLFFLLEQLEELSENTLKYIINQLDGPFSFVYYRDSTIIMGRDIFGIKPLFYQNISSSFTISSEKKILNQQNLQEVLPGEIIIVEEDTFSTHHFANPIELPKLSSIEFVEAEKKLYEFLKKSITKRIPYDKKIGVLFSGGVDSTIIVLVLQELNVPFICYTAEVVGGNIEQASDLKFAKELAEIYSLDLRIASYSVEELEEKTTEVMKIIGESDYIKTSVGLPFHLCAQQARDDGVSVLFSGLGSEELFAGYRRHRNTQDIRAECLNGLTIMYKRDLYRDDVITMASSVELRVPFLDRELVSFALTLPPEFLLNQDKTVSKLILRSCAKTYLGLDERYAYRQKKAAQYGSKFDKGLLRLAKNNNLGKQEYLDWLWDKTIDEQKPQKIWY